MELSIIGNNAPDLVWKDQGVTLPEGTTQEEVGAILRNYAAWRNCSVLALCDVLRFAEVHGFLPGLEPVFLECELSPVDVKKALAIASVPWPFRNPKYLTEEHYFVVSKMLQPDMAKWLNLAVKHKMSALLLKRSIDAGRVLTNKDIEDLTGGGAGLVGNCQSAFAQLERWGKNIGGIPAIRAWGTDTLSAWLMDAAEVKRMIMEAEEELKLRLARDAAAEGGAR